MPNMSWSVYIWSNDLSLVEQEVVRALPRGPGPGRVDINGYRDRVVLLGLDREREPRSSGPSPTSPVIRGVVQ